MKIPVHHGIIMESEYSTERTVFYSVAFRCTYVREWEAERELQRVSSFVVSSVMFPVFQTQKWRGRDGISIKTLQFPEKKSDASSHVFRS